MSHFDDLFWLVEVVEAGTLTAAAEKHQVTSAAVSKRLRQMEERLGVRLLVRTTRRLRTTESGELYYQRGKRLLAAFNELEEQVSSTRDQLCGTIRINAPLSFGLTQLAKPVQAFMQQHQDVNISLHLDDGYIDVLNSDYDLVIRIGELEDSSLVAQRLANVSLVCCAAPSYLAQHGYPQRPNDLSAHECLIYEQNNPFNRWVFYQGANRFEVGVHGRLQANNGDVLCQAAIQGLGIVKQPAFIVQQAVDQGLLTPILCDYAQEQLLVHALYPSRHYLPLKIKYFIECLREWLRHPPTDSLPD